jgi:hypothetical protein
VLKVEVENPVVIDKGEPQGAEKGRMPGYALPALCGRNTRGIREILRIKTSILFG